MAAMNPNMSGISLKVTGLHISVKRQRLSDNIVKNYMLL